VIGLAEIEEIITYTLFSGYTSKPGVSLLIIAEVEGGKSEMVKRFSDNKGIAFPHDATAYGITKDYGPQLVRGEIKHIIFPEFVHCLVRPKETVRLLLAFLNGLISEGIHELHTFRISINFPEPIQCGIICCVTTAEFEWWRKYWEDMGFLSRLLPVSYSYSKRIEEQIFQSIFEGKLNHPPITINLPNNMVQIRLSARLAQRLNPVSRVMGRFVKIRGFRPQIMLQKLAQARALSQGRNVVLLEDIDRIIYLADKYMNFEFRPI